jgi:surfactin synthase thioesterase subunit
VESSNATGAGHAKLRIWRMTLIDAICEYGIIIRRDSLKRNEINLEKLCELMEQSPPLDASDDIVSFGPSFGGEAADEFVRRLQVAGLKYLEDFFVFNGDFPDWCRFKVCLKG